MNETAEVDAEIDAELAAVEAEYDKASSNGSAGTELQGEDGGPNASRLFEVPLPAPARDSWDTRLVPSWMLGFAGLALVAVVVTWTFQFAKAGLVPDSAKRS